MSGAAMVHATGGLLSVFMTGMAGAAGYDMFLRAPNISTLQECHEAGVELIKQDRFIHDDYIVAVSATDEFRAHKFTYDDLRDATIQFYTWVDVRLDGKKCPKEAAPAEPSL